MNKVALRIVKQQKRMLIVHANSVKLTGVLAMRSDKDCIHCKHHFCCITIQIRLTIVRLSPRVSFSKAQCLILKKSLQNSSLRIQDQRTWPYRPVRYAHPHQTDLQTLNQAIHHLRKTRQLHEHRQTPKGSEKGTSERRLQRELSRLPVGNRIQK